MTESDGEAVSDERTPVREWIDDPKLREQVFRLAKQAHEGDFIVVVAPDGKEIRVRIADLPGADLP